MIGSFDGGLEKSMLKDGRIAYVVAPLIAALCPWAASVSAQRQASGERTVESLVILRHAELQHGGLGQLSCRGLNRALMLPGILLPKYGRPTAIFAPNPSQEIHEDGGNYSYVRALASIEPTAIRAGLPVDAEIGYRNIQDLQKQLMQSRYWNATVYICWEHQMLENFTRSMIKSFGGNAQIVPVWKGSNFDTIYVLRIIRTKDSAKLKFDIAQEGLTGSLPASCPDAR